MNESRYDTPARSTPRVSVASARKSTAFVEPKTVTSYLEHRKSTAVTDEKKGELRRSIHSDRQSISESRKSSVARNILTDNLNIKDSIDPRISYFVKRSLISQKIDPAYRVSNIDLFEPGIHLMAKSELNDDIDRRSMDPSFRKFVIPFEVISRQRVRNTKLQYEKQFKHEINQLIDYQSSAREATYFVRLVSYTTFWPPLHNYHELEFVNNRFFQLTPKEKWRLHYIMNNEFN